MLKHRAQNADAFLDLEDRTGEPVRLFLVDLEQVERDALRRLRADARQPAERVDQVLDRRGIVRQSQVPPRRPPRPPGAPPSTSPSPASGLASDRSRLDLLDASVHAGDHEVLEHRRVVGIEGGRIDP